MTTSYPYIQYGGIWTTSQATDAVAAGAWATPPGIGSDANFSNVVLLLPMNQGNGNTTFKDYSPLNQTVTAVGGIAQSSTQYKFPASSGYFTDETKYLTVSNSNMNFGTGDFTVDFWLYYNATAPAFAGFLDNGNQGCYCSYGSSNSNLIFFSTNAGGSSNVTGFAHGMTNETWNFLAFVRSGTTLTIYVNGSSIGAFTGITGSYSPNAGSTAYIGQYSGLGLYSPKTYIQDMRITKGVARYTSNFTPPTTLFPVSA